MNNPVANRGNPQILIRVSGRDRATEAATWKVLVERGKALALRRKRQSSTLHLFANLLREH